MACFYNSFYFLRVHLIVTLAKRHLSHRVRRTVAGNFVPERARRDNQASLPLRRWSAAAIVSHLVFRGFPNPAVRGERGVGVERAVHPGYLVRRGHG